MSSNTHIGRELTGALTLARFDRAGLDYFDFSYEGFWRSFNAIAVALPIVIAAAAVTPDVVRKLAELQPDLSAAQVVTPQHIALLSLTEAIAFVAGWLFFPLAMIWLARLLRIGGRYVPLIVAWNWSRVVSAYAALTPVFLCGIGILSAGFFVFVQFVVFFFVLTYRWFVIRSAGGVEGTTALGLVLFDLVGGFLVETPIRQIYWLFDSGPSVAPGNT